MSTLAELLDRLTGVAVIRERVSETLKVVAVLRGMVFDHERRLLRIEASNDPPRRSGRRKLPSAP